MGSARPSLTPEISSDEIESVDDEPIVPVVVGQRIVSVVTDDLVLDPPAPVRRQTSSVSASPPDRMGAEIAVTGVGERVVPARRAPSVATLPRPIREVDRRGTGDLPMRTGDLASRTGDLATLSGDLPRTDRSRKG